MINRTNLHTMVPRLVLGTLAAAIAALPLLALPAAAQSAGEAEQMLAQADANRDGQVTWAEVVALRKQMFARFDRNADGYIDTRDRPAMFSGYFDEAKGKVARFDTDGDGRISRAELVNGDAPVFAKGDKNGDKILSSEEIRTLRAAR